MSRFTDAIVSGLLFAAILIQYGLRRMYRPWTIYTLWATTAFGLAPTIGICAIAWHATKQSDLTSIGIGTYL